LCIRYGFAKFPQTSEDYDEAKGVSFKAGRTENFGISELKVFDQAIYVDTTSSTADSENFFNELLTWLSETMGVLYYPGMLKRKTYVSQLTFFSESMGKVFHPAVSKLANKLTKRISEIYGQPLVYHPTNFMVSYDPLTIKTGPANFSIERRAETPFAENKFFASAALPTEEHIRVLEELENDLG
jgi:hypothetical protein